MFSRMNETEKGTKEWENHQVERDTANNRRKWNTPREVRENIPKQQHEI